MLAPLQDGPPGAAARLLPTPPASSRHPSTVNLNNGPTQIPTDVLKMTTALLLPPHPCLQPLLPPGQQAVFLGSNTVMPPSRSSRGWVRGEGRHRGGIHRQQCRNREGALMQRPQHPTPHPVHGRPLWAGRGLHRGEGRRAPRGHFTVPPARAVYSMGRPMGQGGSLWTGAARAIHS